MKSIFVDCYGEFNRIAVLENSALADLVIDRKSNASIVGNIYAGLVKTILPNQFVFVDIGASKNAFLYLNDNKDKVLYGNDGKLKIKTGQPLLVQVMKDSTGGKGPYVTTAASYTNKLVVLIRTGKDGSEVSVSRKIAEEAERIRLAGLISEVLPGGYDVILRTSSEGASGEAVREAVAGLVAQADDINVRFEYAMPPALLFKERNIIAKTIGDRFDKQTEVIINDEPEFDALKAELSHSDSEAAARIRLHEHETPIFTYYFIEDKISGLLNKKVWLRCGGFLIIEQTAACVVIDVNSGKFAGKKSHEESVFQLNMEATKEIALQVRLRNLSGIIITDFVDMVDRTHISALRKRFEEELRNDRQPCTLVPDSVLGLICFTRKKSREPISAVLGRGNYNADN